MKTSSYCPKCEINALESLLTPENILHEVEKMAYVEGVTTPSAEYERRLKVCASCSSLNGKTTCAYSGSLVAFRAKILGAGCPFPGEDKWCQN